MQYHSDKRKKIQKGTSVLKVNSIEEVNDYHIVPIILILGS